MPIRMYLHFSPFFPFLCVQKTDGDFLDGALVIKNFWIKSVLWEYSCDKEYLEGFDKGTISNTPYC